MGQKILVAGNLNFFVKELNEDLSRNFSVQVSPCDIGLLMQTTSVSIPDAIILYINSLSTEMRDALIKFMLNNEWVSTKQIIVIGTLVENEFFRTQLCDYKVEFLTRPISIARVRETVERQLETERIDKKSGQIPQKIAGKKHILAVDDDVVLLRSMKAMLEEHFRVTIAKNGVSALTAIGRDKPDLILLDYAMPMSDGKQVYEMIRADEETSSIPVFFLTGVTDAKKIREVLALQPQGYILKSTKNNKVIERLLEFFRENPD